MHVLCAGFLTSTLSCPVSYMHQHPGHLLHDEQMRAFTIRQAGTKNHRERKKASLSALASVLTATTGHGKLLRRRRLPSSKTAQPAVIGQRVNPSPPPWSSQTLLSPSPSSRKSPFCSSCKRQHQQTLNPSPIARRCNCFPLF